MAKTTTLIVLLITFYLLHQDFWNWTRFEPLLFGFLPLGLSYHVGYSLAAAATMAILVRFAWPHHLEQTTAWSTETEAEQ